LKQFSIIWLATGLSFTVVYLCACYLVRAGAFGRLLKDDFNRQARMTARVPLTTILGLIFPPVMLAYLIYYGNKARREHARLREYGQL
jgi:hypothetical protein